MISLLWLLSALFFLLMLVRIVILCFYLLSVIDEREISDD